MASVAESSVNSVPAAQLAQLRDKLLQVSLRSASAGTVHSNTAPSQPDVVHAADAFAIDSDEVARQAPATVPESIDAHYYSPHPPLMNVSKSASEIEMEAMVHPSPSQEAFTTMTRASSFHGYPGGDTQPMESQVYRDFDVSAMKSSIVTPAKAMTEVEDMYTHGSLVPEEAPHTLVEGDVDFVNIVGEMTSPGFEPTQFTEESQLGAVMPQTPAIAGHKRRHSGEILTSVTTAPKTLALSQLFGDGKQDRAILSATQAFNQTQAPSSPIPDGPRSDPAFTRPSPNLASRLTMSSSPLPSSSSPIEFLKPSTASEPRDKYMRIGESQERRALARSRAEIDAQKDMDDELLEEDDDEMDHVLRRANNKRLQRAKSDEALWALSNFRAPSRSGSRNTPKTKSAPVVDLITPVVVDQKAAIDFTTAEDDDASDGEALPEEETLGSADSDLDEYDELGQTVIRSQEADQESENGDVAMNEANENAEAVEDPGDEAVSVTQSTFVDANGTLESGLPRTQHSTVADSQSTRKELPQPVVQANMQPPSSMSLFVPGSQYAGKTSQDRALLASKSRTLPEQRESSSTSPLQQRVPSSPPMPVANTRAEDGDHKILAHEIPESDMPMSDVHQDSSSRPVSANGRGEGKSNNTAVFSIAPTHLSQPVPLSRKISSLASPLKTVASQQSQTASQSPRTAAGVRRFAEIAGMQSPRASNDTQLSIGAIMDGVITADDEEFYQIVSSPIEERPLKRRRVTKSNNVHDEVDKGGASKAVHSQVVERDETSENGDAGELVQDDGQNDAYLSPKPLRESPNKANEMRSKTAEEVMDHEDADEKAVIQPLSALRRTGRKRQRTARVVDMDKMTPESVRVREEAGAKAASQLISKRSTKPAQLGPCKSKKQAASRPNKKHKEVESSREGTEVETEVGGDDPTERQDAGLPGASAVVGEGDEAQEIVSPHRIFTLFKGTHNNFYTATWLRSLPDGLGHRVRFDDGTQTTMELQHIRSLELRVGDQVKVNVDGMRGKNWLIRSFDKNIQKDATETDIYGRARLQVQPKSSRTSVPSTAAVEGEDEVSEVAVSDVYLTHAMWPHFDDRIFNPPSTGKSITSRAVTPSSSAQTPTVETPNSRTRRSFALGVRMNNGRPSYARDEGVTTADSPASVGLFSGMAFAISYGSNEGGKDKVMRAIRGQGGIILDKGFDELFDVPNPEDATITSPGRKASNDDRVAADGNSGLTLLPQYECLGFVALIADRHGRRAKYMQALALGIPTLSSRWVLDSLDATRNATLTREDATPLAWAKYLLPAGESSFLGGAIRSRTMSEYPASDASLSNLLDGRSLLLNGDGVLIIAPKKDKGLWERCKTYAFLTLALGAGIVKRVNDLQEAKALTTDAPETWKWVYVDGSVAEASSIVFGKRGADGKKRKRDDQATKGAGDALCMGNGTVKVVNNEFVVQSLILGELID